MLPKEGKGIVGRLAYIYPDYPKSGAGAPFLAKPDVGSLEQNSNRFFAQGHGLVTVLGSGTVYFLPMKRLPTVRDAREYLNWRYAHVQDKSPRDKIIAVAKVLVFERKRA